MGIFFKKDKKEKLIDKLYNSFYEKENLIVNYKYLNDVVDAIIVTKKGIFLFLIYVNDIGITKFSLKKDIWVIDNEISIENPIKLLEKIKTHILSILHDDKLPIFLCPIFNKLDNNYETDIFTIKDFRKFIDDIPLILESDEINEYTKIIKEDNN